jgi:hypothetical protein
MKMSSDTLEIVPFADAARVAAVGSHVYSAVLVEGYCIGSGERECAARLLQQGIFNSFY